MLYDKQNIYVKHRWDNIMTIQASTLQGLGFRVKGLGALDVVAKIGGFRSQHSSFP